ncbi:MAG: winged helix-turn-helix domain-containing protein [Marinobacterium sp.]|nr:winged helix-turn-helix domain-containing protein [Marinobacterium sp.]
MAAYQNACTGNATLAAPVLEERVLIVEQGQQALQLSETLQAQGFYVIGSTDRGEDAVQICAELEPTLVLMNTFLCGRLRCTEAARQIHRRFNIPVVFMTDGDEDATISDTCQSWPYGSLPRACRDQQLVQALRRATGLRRQQDSQEVADLLAKADNKGSPCIQVSEVASYPLYSGCLNMNGRAVRLTPKEQKFLDLLGRHQGSVVPFDRIFQEVWDDRINGFQPLRILVHRLRRKLGAGDGIENVFEMGYRLNILARSMG